MTKKQLTSETLGEQLRCPSGQFAKEVGENMFLSNGNMILKTIDSLDIKSKSSVLEIGFGNGKHLPYLFDKNQNLTYTGIDISEEMTKEATLNNTDLVNQKSAEFLVVKPDEKLPFKNDSFDYCFTVNTIYFIGNPKEYFLNILNFLKPNGKLSIGFIAKDFGEKLPFTQKGFTFYSSEEITSSLLQIGFNSFEIKNLTEDTITKDGQKVNRPFSIVTAEK